MCDIRILFCPLYLNTVLNSCFHFLLFLFMSLWFNSLHAGKVVDASSWNITTDDPFVELVWWSYIVTIYFQQYSTTYLAVQGVKVWNGKATNTKVDTYGQACFRASSSAPTKLSILLFLFKLKRANNTMSIVLIVLQDMQYN